MTTTTNDAADRLSDALLDHMRPASAEQLAKLLDAALAAERRATVERIRAEVVQYGIVDVPIKRLLAILEAERDR